MQFKYKAPKKGSKDRGRDDESSSDAKAHKTPDSAGESYIAYTVVSCTLHTKLNNNSFK